MSLKYHVIEIFTSEDVRWQGKPLYEAIVQHVSRLKIAARCIVSRGMAGCYENGEAASQKILMLSFNMPLKIEIIFPAPELDRVLPGIEEMVEEGIVVVEDMEVHSHRTRRRLIPKHLLVRDAMTPSPRAISPSTPVNEVVRLLLSADFHGVPVIDENNRVAGIITQRDLIARAGMRVRLGLLARLEQEQVDAHLTGFSDKTAGNVMTQPAVVIQEDRALTEAVELMLKKDLKRLPVVDAEDQLVGMLSRVDIFRVATRETPDFRGFETYRVVVNNVRYVRDIMRRDTHTVRPDTPLHEVIRSIDSSDIQRVAVVDETGRFLGLIFDHDLLAVFADYPKGLWDYFISKLPFAEVGRRHRELAERLQDGTAEAFMQRDIVTVQEDTLIEDAIGLMVANGFKRIPVVDDDGLFKGMISRDAVLRLGAGE